MIFKFYKHFFPFYLSIAKFNSISTFLVTIFI
ncbi:hypothetical protein cje96_02784 [Campylobacter jejuni subsp. jejuni LMG 23211]|nr:hypothetical protein cje84_03028 [Campylobacter jejuni subsp. jejuni 1928]EIB92237.1 hypothetical protein cje96_02784 [Campylobacter jejuni subsp. jejuni LMG 23211]